eukprot:Em0030g39a
MPALASFAVLLLFCIDGAIGDLVTSFVQNEMTAFQMEPQSKAVKYGSSARFSCNSSITPTGYPSYPNLIITWYKDGSAINIDERIVRQQQGGYSTLEIRSVTNSDAGCYQCSIQDGPSYEDMPCPSLLAGPASYMYITLSAPAYLVVISIPPVIYLGKISKTIYIQKHETKLLFCQASGNPYPTLSWYKNGKTLNNHTLVISYDNYGIFQCFANNTAGVTYETIRVLRYGVPNPPQNLHCTPKELSYMILGQAILSWTKPTYSGYPTVAASANIFYTVTVCTNGHAESQDRTSATLYKTIMQNDFYTYFYYISISINGTSSGKTFCRIFPPDRYLEPRGFETVNCSGNSALATWNVDPYNLFVTVNSVTIWGFCLNGTKTKCPAPLPCRLCLAMALTLQGDNHIDALPYVDQGYEDAGVREGALRLVEEETRRYKPTKNYLEHLSALKSTFETPIVKAEFDRISARQPMELLSMKRYELPQPGTAQKNDLAAWQEAVDNSMAQLEHQVGRITNLELLSQYSVNEWKLHNGFLTQMVEHEQKKLKQLRGKVQEVNWQRKTEQAAAGAQLQTLSNHWNALVHKNFEIEKACVELEKELETLREKLGQRNSDVPPEEPQIAQ